MRPAKRLLRWAVVGLYRALLWALPADFRRRYGAEMADVVATRIDARLRERGAAGAVGLAAAEAADLLWTAVRTWLGRDGLSPVPVAAGLAAVLAMLVVASPERPRPEAGAPVLASSGASTAARAQDPATSDTLSLARALTLLERAARVEPADRVPILIELADYRFRPETRATFLAAERGLCASRDHRRLLQALVSREGLGDDERAELVREAARRIDLSRELAGLVVETVGERPIGPGLARAYRAAVAAIDRDRDRARADAALRAVASSPERAFL